MVIAVYQKRFFFAALLVAILAYMFWTGSRYPALDEKAMMSGAIQLEDPLGFEAKFPLTEGMNTLERIFYSTLNWINTNKKGMTFGVLFAAAFLTAAAYLKRRSFIGSFSNSALGLVIGTPLGVCVNCAAPIAKGMYSAGLRAETTLSAMIASPTLNVVVLTMLFSLLPFYMAVTKIALSLVLILLVVPLICRMLPPAQLEVQPDAQKPQPWDLPDQQEEENILQAFVQVVISYLKNLWYIIKLTVPLMILAGFLGAVVATLLPQDLLNNLGFSAPLVLLISLVGVFLPVPIAFDVVVTGALLSSGLEAGYVMALLFTLGSFSIYSFFIVSQAISLRAGLMLAGAVVAFGTLSGIAVDRYHNWQTERALEILTGALPTLIRPAEAQTAPQYVIENDIGTVTVDMQPFAPRKGGRTAGFTRMEARAAGIDKPNEFSFKDMWPPFWEGRSLATGDIDRDGDFDVVIASTEVGLYVYTNDGSGQFTRQDQPLGPLAGVPIFNAALADLDNDGFQDLFIATYRQGNWQAMNRGGRFDMAGAMQVDNVPDAVLSIALSFGDTDLDGDLDVALGNWAAGWYRRVPGEESRNRIVLNGGRGLGPDHIDLPGIPGETLSLLLSDINGDMAPDLLVGNDFEIPDYTYLNDGSGGMTAITYQDGLIPHTTTTTMAVKTADLHNDGGPEIYLAQIAGRSSGVSETLKMQDLRFYCDGIDDAGDRATCARNMQIKTWYKSGNNFDPTYAGKCQEMSGTYQAECKAMLVKDLAIQRRDPQICALIPAEQPIPRAFCDLHFRPIYRPTEAEAAAVIPQIMRSNVLLEPDGAGWRDVAEAQGLDIGGWSWDTKIADFDNDGWQDVYVVNGTWVPNEVSPSNLFFRNMGDGTFSEASGPFGLEDYLMTAAATRFDMDMDGDLDILTHTVNGPLALFRNDGTEGEAIAFALHDRIGNADGIGARITTTDSNGATRTREIQLGGGFMSFDAPVAHFGLGDATEVTSVTVQWPGGGRTTIASPLRSGALYHIGRQPD